MSEHYNALQEHLKTIVNINAAIAVLNYDKQTQMPHSATEARAAQTATLARISHELFVSEKTARLLEEAAREIDGADYDSDQASMIRVVQQDYEQAVKLPTELVAEQTRLSGIAHEKWVQARATSDFQVYQSTLEQVIDLAIQRAEYLGYEDHPYDALLNQYERGMKAAQVKALFDEHKPALVELVANITASQHQVDNAVLYQAFDTDQQREFARSVVAAFGFDFNRGGLGLVVHPFATRFSRSDVRITTRYNPNYLSAALMALMHEAGHGMYEQGTAPSLDGTPLGRGASAGVHESQSRMWENLVGRSRPFWQWALRRLRQVFPTQLEGVDVETMYRAVNKVQPSFIRVEADEATYNLHIMLRFELEMQMVTGQVKVADLPKEWNARFEAMLGIVPPADAVGVLQDVHWSMGLFGHFSTYALGNLLSVQYFNKAVQDHPAIPDEIASGKFDTLHNWAIDNIYQHGRKFTADELTRRVTGESIQSRDYMRYLQTKYGEIYRL